MARKIAERPLLEFVKQPNNIERPLGGLTLSSCLLTVLWGLGSCGGTPAASVSPVHSSFSTTQTPERAFERSTAQTPERSLHSVDSAKITEILQRIAHLRGSTLKRPPPVLRAELPALTEALVREMTYSTDPAVIRAQDALYRALGVVPIDFDSLRDLPGLFAKELDGVYLTVSGEIMLRAGVSEEELTMPLAHELTHAIQDERHKLSELVHYRALAGDRIAVIHALAEGEALSLGLDVALSPLENPSLQLDPRQMRERLLAQDQGNLPAFLWRSIVSSYTDGFAYVSALRKSGGWRAVDDAWNTPPSTTAALLRISENEPLPQRFAELDPLPLPPTALGTEVGDATYTLVLDDVMGEQTLRDLLSEVLTEPDSAYLARSWRADRAAVFTAGKWRATALHFRFTSDSTARSVARVLGQVLLSHEGSKERRSVGPLSHCSLRRCLGPTVVTQKGTDVAVALGPWTEDCSIVETNSLCPGTRQWASRVLASRAK